MATRHNLTLQEKIQLIFDNNEGNGLSQRKLAAKYNISFGSVSNILKRKKEYLNDYEANRNQNVKRKFKNENGRQLDDQIYEWFVQQRTKRIPISGPILQEKAPEIAESLGDKFGSFKASNGWLDKFITRHNISHYVIRGEGSFIMDMDTYIPEEHIIQSENNDNSITEDQVELIDTSLNVVTSYDRFLKSEPIPKRKHPQPSQLPETVTVLNDNITNGTIYLVGTAHFSEKSQREVAEIIQLTQPDIVMVELCQSRVNILSLDEQTLMKEASQMNLQKLRTIIKANGVVHGVIHVLLLSMTANLTKQLGMAPGGEFRTAFRQAQKVPGCNVVLGDRPVGITLKRAINSLSTWKKIRLVFSLLTSNDKVTNEDVEKCMEHDMLEKLLLEMSDKYPELSRVFIQERDQFLAYSLRKCAQQIPIETNENGFVPATVVGVVGIGHVKGIVQQWNQPTINDVQHLMTIDIDDKLTRRSTFSTYASLSFKLACVGAVVAAILQYTRYRLR